MCYRVWADFGKGVNFHFKADIFVFCFPNVPDIKYKWTEKYCNLFESSPSSWGIKPWMVTGYLLDLMMWVTEAHFAAILCLSGIVTMHYTV
jgi:hypothetical protein